MKKFSIVAAALALGIALPAGASPFAALFSYSFKNGDTGSGILSGNTGYVGGSPVLFVEDIDGRRGGGQPITYLPGTYVLVLGATPDIGDVFSFSSFGNSYTLSYTGTSFSLTGPDVHDTGGTFTFNGYTFGPTPVPEAASLGLLGIGMAGIALARRRRA